MKPVKVILKRQIYELVYTVGAAIGIQDEFGDCDTMIAAIDNANSALRVDAVCRAAAIMIEQGELVRRYMGHQPQPILSRFDIASRATEEEMITLRMAIPVAISAGIHRELENEPAEIDLGLQELNEEKGDHFAPAYFYRMGAVNGLTKKETLLSTPGELLDLWSLYAKAHGIRQNTDMD